MQTPVSNSFVDRHDGTHALVVTDSQGCRHITLVDSFMVPALQRHFWYADKRRNGRTYFRYKCNGKYGYLHRRLTAVFGNFGYDVHHVRGTKHNTLDSYKLYDRKRHRQEHQQLKEAA